MKKLATMLRTGQLFAHNAHHSVYGPTFFEDHEFFGEAYEDIGKAYDDVVERGIATGCIKTSELKGIQVEAAKAIPDIGSCAEMLLALGNLDTAVCGEIDKIVKGASITQGTENMLQGIADSTEKRWSYLIRRRLTGSY